MWQPARSPPAAGKRARYPLPRAHARATRASRENVVPQTHPRSTRDRRHASRGGRRQARKRAQTSLLFLSRAVAPADKPPFSDTYRRKKPDNNAPKHEDRPLYLPCSLASSSTLRRSTSSFLLNRRVYDGGGGGARGGDAGAGTGGAPPASPPSTASSPPPASDPGGGDEASPPPQESTSGAAGLAGAG